MSGDYYYHFASPERERVFIYVIIITIIIPINNLKTNNNTYHT